jgi:hypothetical protein
VLIQLKRGARTLAWLVTEFGGEAVSAACLRLAIRVRGYVSSDALLGTVPPKEFAATPFPDALRRLCRIREALGGTG